MNKIIAGLLLRAQSHDCVGFKIYESTPDIVYYYRDFDDKYYTKTKIKATLSTLSSLLDISTDYLNKIVDNRDFYETLYKEGCEYLKYNRPIKICRLKTEAAIRIRFDLDKYSRGACTQAINTLITHDDLPKERQKSTDTSKEKKVIKEKKKMEDFSLTNLKNALVSKITSLDKKTVTILALIALALLVVGKYQDIKDILIGIKDKVKRSKNFKAMVADGTAAVNSLKKIIGIKDEGKDNNKDEA